MTTNNQFWEVLGLTLIDSLWQGAVITLIALLGLVLLRKTHARLRHNLLLICILALPVCSIYSFVRYSDQAAPAIVNNAAGEMSTEIVDSSSLIIENQQVSTPVSKEIELFGLPLEMHWFGLLWMFGLLFMIAKSVGAYLFLHRLRLASSIVDDKSINSLLKQLRSSFGLNRLIELRESTQISSPMVYGYLKPVILFPLGLIQGLTTEEVEVILLHELAHLKRNDFLINIVINVLRAAYFYHPAFWWLQGQLDNEREFATDEMVMSRQSDGLLLIRALTKTQEFKMTTSLGFAGSSKYQLLKRVNRIMKKQSTPNWLSSVMVVAILSISSLLISQSAKQDLKDQDIKKERKDSIQAPFKHVYLPLTDSISSLKFEKIAPAYYRIFQYQDTAGPITLKFNYNASDKASFDSLKTFKGVYKYSLVPIYQDTNKVYRAVLEIIKKDSPIEIEVGDDGEVLEIRRNGKTLKNEEFKVYKAAYNQLQEYAITVIKKKEQQEYEEQAKLLHEQLRQYEKLLQALKNNQLPDELETSKELLLKRLAELAGVEQLDLDKQSMEQLAALAEMELDKQSILRQQKESMEQWQSQRQLQQQIVATRNQYELLWKMMNQGETLKLDQKELEELIHDLQQQLKDAERALEDEKSKQKRKKRKKDNNDNEPFDFEATVYSDDHTKYAFPNNEYKEEYLDWTYNSFMENVTDPLIVWNGKIKSSWSLEHLKELPSDDIRSIEVLKGEGMDKYPRRKTKGRGAVIEVVTQ